MKKILIAMIITAMLLSLGVVFTSAITLPGKGYVDFSEGMYCVENPDEFSPVGDITVTWDPEASDKLDVTDGDMSDWAAAGYNMISIDASNMIAWRGGYELAPEGWGIKTYFVADSEWLYIGFYVTDPHFTYGDSSATYNGDAFQVCIDFGGKLGYALETDPELLMGNPKNIFYSFACIEDGAPLQIMRQEAENDMLLSQANGDGVMGCAKKTYEGWSAEFALSFEMLYDDYVWKAYETDPKIYVGGEEERPLKIGCCLYYLNRQVTGGDVDWAAGSSSGITHEGKPMLSWSAYDNGVNLLLPYQEGIEFDCENIVVIPKTETIPPETEAPTDPATDAPTEAPTEVPTSEPIGNETNASTDKGDGTNGSDDTNGDDKGCSSIVSMSAAVVLTAIAAAVVLKKKN